MPSSLARRSYRLTPSPSLITGASQAQAVTAVEVPINAQEELVLRLAEVVVPHYRLPAQ
jgi:hypothetical protein